jgi:hypothetical protein
MVFDSSIEIKRQCRPASEQQTLLFPKDPDIEENAIFDTSVDLPAMHSEGKPSKMFLDDLG